MRARRRSAVLCLLFLDPARVMLPGPVEIDLTGPHGVEGPLHSDGADMDMRQQGGNEEHGDHGVDHGPELQRWDGGRKVGEYQEPAGNRHQRTADDHDPENTLLPGVKALRRWMLADG